MITIIRWIKFLLRVLGLYQEEIVKPEQAEQVQAAVAAQEVIVHETQAQVAAVPAKTDADLRDDAISLGLVSDDDPGPDDPGGAPPIQTGN